MILEISFFGESCAFLCVDHSPSPKGLERTWEELGGREDIKIHTLGLLFAATTPTGEGGGSREGGEKAREQRRAKLAFLYSRFSCLWSKVFPRECANSKYFCSDFCVLRIFTALHFAFSNRAAFFCATYHHAYYSLYAATLVLPHTRTPRVSLNIS